MKLRRECRYLTALALFLCLAVYPLMAQEQEGEYTYEEYSYYNKAKTEADLAKKELALFEFLEKFPDSKLMPHVMAEFQNYFNALVQRKSYDQAVTTAKKLLEIRKDENVAISAISSAYYLKQDWSNYAVYADMMYAKTPSGDLAYYIAAAAVDGNVAAMQDKYIPIVESNGTLPMRVVLAHKQYSKAFAAQDQTKALEYARKIDGLFTNNAKPDNFQGDWSAFVKQYHIPVLSWMAAAIARANDLEGAAAVYAKLVEFNPRDAGNQYRLGMIYWRAKKATQAGLPLAKAVVLNDPRISPNAERDLRELTKEVPDKYNEYIEAAKKELGIV